MNPALSHLQLYPFQRLNALKADLPDPPRDKAHIALSIGEPKHPAADFLVDALGDESLIRSGLGTYPATLGSEELRVSISDWLGNRFSVQVDPQRQVLPVNGTREALFSFGQAVLSGKQGAAALLPNPFYQIYEGAILMRGAQPVFMPTHRANGYLPDFASIPEETWRRCELVYLCSPGNPTGAVLDMAALEELLELRDRYDFVIASDECYSEIYADEQNPPPGLLQACASTGRDNFTGCVVFHSLSKRSNLPGLRSGFVAGDAELLAPYYQYRTYHGCAMPAQVQAISAIAWRDEEHVLRNRALYREKFAAVTPIIASCLDVEMPQAAFYLWPQTPIDDQDFAANLFATQNVTVLPGQFLSRRGADGKNPGTNHVRIALVAPLADCIEAAERIKAHLN